MLMHIGMHVYQLYVLSGSLDNQILGTQLP